MTTALKDLEVDRNDGVDEPATRKRWLVLKTEDVDELETNLQGLADLTASAIAAIQKGAVALDPLSAKKLERIVKMLGPKNFSGSFTIRKEEDETGASAGTGEAKKETAATSEAPKQEAQAPSVALTKDDRDALKCVSDAVKDFRETIEKYFASEDDEDEDAKGKKKAGVKKARKDEDDEDPESTQLESGRRVRKSAPKLGEGLFDDVLFGARAED